MVGKDTVVVVGGCREIEELRCKMLGESFRGVSVVSELHSVLP